MENYQLIEFFEERKSLCAFVLDDRGDRLHVLTEQNREMNLARKRVMHAVPWPAGAKLGRQELVEHLKQVGQRREALKREINLAEVWELLVDEGVALSTADMARQWFGDKVTPDQVAALGRALAEDRFYFKHKAGLWTPHPPEVVVQLQEQERREEARRRELAAAGQWLREAWEGREITDPAWREKLINILKEMAIYGPDSDFYELGQEYLAQAKLTKPEIPFKLLVKLGVFQPDENLDLYRYEAPQEFTPEVQEAAQQLSAASDWPDPWREQRQDLTALETFTIDGERTRDFDDALSLERISGGYRLGIHIADVASFVEKGQILDQAALERGTSLYLPERRIAMLPELLSENTFSLIAGEVRRAISFLVELTESGELVSWRIVPSLIRVGQRLTYRDVDFRLSLEPRFTTLHRLAEKLRQRRLQQGGIQLQFPEVIIVVDAQGEVHLEVEDLETPSHEIVSEAMILANYLGARFLADHQVPALYRCQAPPREELEQVSNPTLFHLWQNRRRLSRVLLDPEPQPHWGLGLPVYTTLSSPIRRYLDLLLQRQLAAALAGQPLPYSREELEDLAMTLEGTLRRAAILKTRRQRYWLIKYLSQHLGQKFPALVLEKHPTRYRLLLTDLLLETDLPAPSGHQFHPGETILIKIDRANPQEDLLKVSLA